MSAQVRPQDVAGATQFEAHVRVASQTGVGARQRAPQPPQSVLVSRGVSQPLLVTRSQSSQPTSQLAISQPVGPQRETACESEQLTPQPRQSDVVSSAVSQPLPRSPSQSAWPESQRIEQRPSRHTGEALVADAHTSAQLEQAVGRPRTASHPFPGERSQSP